ISNGSSFETKTNKEDSRNGDTVGMNEEENEVKIYSVNKRVKVEHATGEVKVYNLNGEEVASTTSDGNAELTVNSNPGYFIVAVINEAQIKTQKVYIQ
ncbi:MAG: T9SS type A sorting domain-containing protein, partial [Bacteroidetes bacterium]|nr:T9SS type A sorting domain-containing protein [Bacteroidota bacterium]